MAVDPELVEILVDPETKRAVRAATAAELAQRERARARRLAPQPRRREGGARARRGARARGRPRALPRRRRHPGDADRGVDRAAGASGASRERYCANSRFLSSRTYSVSAGSEATSCETRASNSAALALERLLVDRQVEQLARPSAPARACRAGSARRRCSAGRPGPEARRSRSPPRISRLASTPTIPVGPS